LGLLADGVPRGVAEIAGDLGLGGRAVEGACYREWKKGSLLRSSKQVYGRFTRFRGRSGNVSNTRGFYRYLIRVEGQDRVRVGGVEYVPYGEEFLSPKIPKGESKSKRILRFLQENSKRAWYSTEIVEELEDEGIRSTHIMPAVRRAEKKGLLYVRGYRTETRQTAFSKGFLIAVIDQDKPRDAAIDEAFQKTDSQLNEDAGSNVVGRRIRAIRDEILVASKSRELVGYDYLRNKVDGSESQLKYAVRGLMRLYNDVRRVDVFGFPYFYQKSFPEADLDAAVEMKKSYIRVAKGRDNRIGHNYEAVAEWFVDKLMIGAQFRTQNHRDPNMDSRRITLNLIKPVGHRKRNAEVDRVWSIKTGLLTDEITYILQSKWGLVTKRDLDDHIEVIRWSREYGVDTTNSRAIKQGVTPIFTGGSYNPRNTVRIGDEEINLPEYARRMNIQLIKSADLNQKLHQKGVETYVTVQKVCRLAKDEKQVRETLTKIWNQPNKARGYLNELTHENKELFEFEKQLTI
jgi:hypothetical protein